MNPAVLRTAEYMRGETFRWMIGPANHAFKSRDRSSTRSEGGKRSLQRVIVLAALLLALPALVQAAPVGKLTYVENEVYVIKTGVTPRGAQEGDPVSVGDKLSSGENSKAEITFIDDNVIRLGENTWFEITEYFASGQSRSGIINLLKGTLRHMVHGVKSRLVDPRKSGYVVNTPVAIVGVRGTDFFTKHLLGMTTALVLQGVTGVQNPRFVHIVVPVRDGQKTQVTADKPPTAPVLATDAEIQALIDETSPEEKPPPKSTPMHGGPARGEPRYDQFFQACFVPGTRVLMADGTRKPIEQLRIGDIVQSYDRSSDFLKPTRIVQTFQSDHNQYYIINGGLRATARHPLLTSEGWKYVSDLKVGDRLRAARGLIDVRRIEEVKRPEVIKVHNLSVEKRHNFLVSDGLDDFVAHNTRGGGGGGSGGGGFYGPSIIKEDEH